MDPPAGPSTPAPTRSLNRQVVLDEDEYTAALSHIIARDFFPSLVHLDATNDYLDALRSHDTERIDATVRRLESLSTPAAWRTPAQTPYAAGPSDTPLRTPREPGEPGEPPEKRARYATDMSLDAFQARYTSEDNSSFTQILEDENRRRRERWGWAWEAQKRVEAQRERMLEGRERLLLEAPPGTGVRGRVRIEAPEPRGLITGGEEANEGASEAVGKSGAEEGGEVESAPCRDCALAAPAATGKRGRVLGLERRIRTWKRNGHWRTWPDACKLLSMRSW